MRWFRSRWTIGITVVLAIFIVLAVLGYWLQWDWTGLPEHTIPDPQKYQPAKTAWDWLQMLGVLAIPVVAGFGVAWYTSEQTRVRETIATQQHKIELEKAEQQRETELEAAKQRHQTELEIAADNQHEIMLQAYIDKISELLLIKESDSFLNMGVRNIARIRTLTALQRLNSPRKLSLLQFLHEAALIGTEAARGSESAVIDLQGANLVGANLNHIYLGGADLKRSN